VGNNAGARILAGQIRRGDADEIRAAIWLSDMRGYTNLSDRLPPQAIVRVLNDYFDCQVPTILEHGGEVLKFMGDGLLAIFPIAADDSNIDEVCRRVLAAARATCSNVDALNAAEGKDLAQELRFGLALHVGEVLYGSIGGAGRLDFTWIGPAVNLVARLEKVAAQLGRALIASAEFAQHCRSDMAELGEFFAFSLAGFGTAQTAYVLRDEETWVSLVRHRSVTRAAAFRSSHTHRRSSRSRSARTRIRRAHTHTGHTHTARSRKNSTAPTRSHRVPSHQ
jgi:adenylate cyclase